MGYTHYWYRRVDPPPPPDAYGRLAVDARAIVAKAAELGYDLAGGMGDGEPEVGEGRICLNGRNPDQSYETFLFEAVSGRPYEVEPGWHFDCCKIGFMSPESFRRYGDVVEAILIRAAVHYGDAIRVRSDGAWGPDEAAWGTWDGGKALYEATFAEDPPCPLEPDEEPATP